MGQDCFILNSKEKLEFLGLRQVSGDPAMFTFHQDGKLAGIVCLHVDDLLLMGNNYFLQHVPQKLFQLFSVFKSGERKI